MGAEQEGEGGGVTYEFKRLPHQQLERDMVARSWRELRAKDRALARRAYRTMCARRAKWAGAINVNLHDKDEP